MRTRTGGYPIGFRRGNGEWQSDLSELANWAVANNLEVIDLRKDAPEVGQIALDAGLRIGTVDLANNKGMISADKGKRAAAVAENAEYVKNCAKYGRVNHFLTMLPDDPTLPRVENFGYMVESYAELAPVLEQNNACIAIEGWPGPGALCCTPEGYRALFREVPSLAMGINYDPSHLIRMDIDHLRFLREFVGRVYHVHGKDTELLTEDYYEYGREQPPTFAVAKPFSGMTWRYTIPGHGVARWAEIFEILKANSYSGCVSIELEDRNFYREPDAEREGILQGARFLTSC